LVKSEGRIQRSRSGLMCILEKVLIGLGATAAIGITAAGVLMATLAYG
jgi:hypothetical protein